MVLLYDRKEKQKIRIQADRGSGPDHGGSGCISCASLVLSGLQSEVEERCGT